MTSSMRTYPAGAEPQFTATATTGGSPCRITDAATFVVTSGPARVWGSADCADGGAALTVAIPPARELHESWDLKRSAPACATVFGTRTATEGTYHVTATVDGVTSAPVRFSLA